MNSASALEVVERDDLLRVFQSKDVNGAFVVLDIEKDKLVTVGSTRVDTRFVPASTFKIFNSLIALETKAVSDENEIIPYGGKPQPFKSWERDMSIRSAIQISNVPVFQEVARRVGLVNYGEYLKVLGYGNMDAGNKVDHFWLDGPLKISAIEQVHAISKLAKQKLPASNANQQTVRSMIRLESNGNVVLFGKTGWSNAPEPDIGWFVGWVEKGNSTFAFALNMDMDSVEDAKLRKPLVKELLRLLEIY